MPRDRDLLTGTLAAVIAASLFGLLGPLARFGAEAGVDGVAFTAWRAALGVAFLAALIAVRRTVRASIGALRALDRRGRASLVTAALTGLLLNAAMFSAFNLVPIALALMLFYTYPAGVVAVEAALGRETITPTRLAALALSSAGVVLVLAGGLDGSGGAVQIAGLGVVLGLGAAACQVVFVLVSRSGYRSVPSDAAMLVNLGASLVGSVVIALLIGQAAGLVQPFRSLDPWPFLLLAGVAAAGMSSLLFLTAIRRIGGTRTGILMLLEPVVGTVLAGLLLGEALGPVQLLGGALVLAGALVLQLNSAPEQAPVLEAGAGPLV